MTERHDATLKRLHDRLGSMIDQVGHPDYSLREMVNGLREVRDELFAVSETPATGTMTVPMDFERFQAAFIQAIDRQAELVPHTPGWKTLLELVWERLPARIPSSEPAMWRREWEGDDSDLGQWIYADTAEERDEPLDRWQPLYEAPQPAPPPMSKAEWEASITRMHDAIQGTRSAIERIPCRGCEGRERDLCLDKNRCAKVEAL